MFQKHPTNRAVSLAPILLLKRGAGFVLQKRGSFFSETVNNLAGTASMIIVNLRPRPLQKAMVIEQLQPPQKLLRTVANEGDDVGRPQKTVPADQPDDFTVTLRKSHRGNLGR